MGEMGDVKRGVLYATRASVTSPMVREPGVKRISPNRQADCNRHRRTGKYTMHNRFRRWRQRAGAAVAQTNPEPNYDQNLVDRVVEYLQTRDGSLFPFSAGFDAEREKSFVRDLRDGLGGLLESGSARKTSATGFIMSDKRLYQIVREWANAGGDWPEGANPTALRTSIAPLPNADPMDTLETGDLVEPTSRTPARDAI